MDDREQRIRDRAYAIWQREGHPEGREREHWQQAAREIDDEGERGEPRGDAGRAPAGGGAAIRAEPMREAQGGAAKAPSRKKAAVAGATKPSGGGADARAAKDKSAPAAREKAPAKPRKKDQM